MYCQVCGTQLPAEAKACPNCGTLTPTYDANPNASPYDPTIPAVSDSSPRAMGAPPSTQYGSNPYDVSLQSPYDVNPYPVPPPPPSPLPLQPPRKVSPVMLGILIVLILLIVGAGVGFVFLRNNGSNTDTNATASVTGQNFTVKGTFTILSKSNVHTRQDGQNTISSYTQQEVDYGDVTGPYTVEETLILHADNTGNFSGSSTCTCTVAGKSGTLMWSYTGTSTANGSFQGQYFNVHGTGDLANLHGQGNFQGQGSQGTYSSEYHFNA